MKTNEDIRKRDFRRQVLRAEYQSLFWHALLTRKKEAKFSLKALADKLGIHKSYVSRSFSSPPNWTIDKLSDMADALNVDLIVEARDRANGRLYTSTGNAVLTQTSTYLVCSDKSERKSASGSDLTLNDSYHVRANT